MDELEKRKLEWEIVHIRFQLIFAFIKAFAYSLVAVFIFFYITNPEWTLKKENVKDEIKRERAKLTIDLLKLENYEDILFGLEIIKDAYGAENIWIEQIETKYKSNIQNKMSKSFNPTDSFEERMKKQLELINNRNENN